MPAMTVLYSEMLHPDDTAERAVFGAEIQVLSRESTEVAALSDADCAAADGLMMFRHFLRAPDIARFPKLRAVVRMGVGYDRLDRATLAERGVVVCNVPDYGTTEVADHAITLALTLRRGLPLHMVAQRTQPPAAWRPLPDPLVRRSFGQGFGIVGLGRIGTAVALRAKAFGFRVAFFDPELPNGTELALGIERAPTLGALLRTADVLSLHTPLTAATRNLVGAAELALLPAGAVVVNTARGPVLDVDALADALQSGHLAGAGLDVLPVEPPDPEPPRLLRAWRDREPWCEGRVIITPHSAFWTPEAERDIRLKAAETMRAALLGPRATNVILPEMG